MKNICHDLLIYTPTAFLSQPFSGGNLSPKRQSLKRAHSSLSLQHLADLHEGRNAKGFKMKKKVAKDFCGRPMSDNQRSNIQMMGYLLCLNNNSWLYPHPSFFFSFFLFVFLLRWYWLMKPSKVQVYDSTVRHAHTHTLHCVFTAYSQTSFCCHPFQSLRVASFWQQKQMSYSELLSIENQ